MRQCGPKLPSGAIGCLRRRRCHTIQPSDSAVAITVAQAPLVTPSGGRPVQPRISAGVRTMIAPEETSSDSSGVTVSLTPRSTDAVMTETNSSGRNSIITRA